MHRKRAATLEHCTHGRPRPHLVIETFNESTVAAAIGIKVVTLVAGVVRHVFFFILVVGNRVIIAFAVLHHVVVVDVDVSQLTVEAVASAGPALLAYFTDLGLLPFGEQVELDGRKTIGERSVGGTAAHG
ncbi:hypothetical protein PG991_002404 [Apiospora marii]|uniref:Uncharacterized protein n=1 Tax=Apiospora marii TaxID=335849 RepID=A0ABR1SGJ5_9PEZI